MLAFLHCSSFLISLRNVFEPKWISTLISPAFNFQSSIFIRVYGNAALALLARYRLYKTATILANGMAKGRWNWEDNSSSAPVRYTEVYIMGVGEILRIHRRWPPRSVLVHHRYSTTPDVEISRHLTGNCSAQSNNSTGSEIVLIRWSSVSDCQDHGREESEAILFLQTRWRHDTLDPTQITISPYFSYNTCKSVFTAHTCRRQSIHVIWQCNGTLRDAYQAVNSH